MKNDKVGVYSYGLREIAGQRRQVYLECERKLSATEDYEIYTLSFFAYNPLFKVGTAEAALRVLQNQPKWYNSSALLPAWGQIDPDSLEVFRIEEVPSLKVVKIRPVVFEEVVSRKYIAHRQCEDLLKKELAPHYSWTTHVVVIPAGESLETLKRKCEGATIHVGITELRASMYCQAVLPATANQVTLITTSKSLD
jgi:hypothetical protein